MAGRRRNLSLPLRQGALDGLCGIYAVINAARALCPECSDHTCDQLFTALMNRLSASRKPLTLTYQGISRHDVRKLMQDTIVFVGTQLAIDLTAAPVARRLRKQCNLHQLWQQLADHTNSGGVVILGLSGCLAHWSVATRVTKRQIRLFDSDGLCILRRSHCTVDRRAIKRTRLTPQDMILVSRKLETTLSATRNRADTCGRRSSTMQVPLLLPYLSHR